MSKQFCFLNRLLAIGSLACTMALASGSTYYISTAGSDTNPGTLALPLATITKASTLTVAGDTVYLLGGTYQWSKAQVINGDGILGAWVTYAPYQSSSVVIDGSLMPTGTAPININGQYVQFSNFTVQNGPKNDICVWGNGHKIQIRNCICTGSLQAGIQIATNTAGTVSDILVDSCTITNCVLENSSLTVTPWTPAVQTTMAQNVTVSNCTVDQNYGEGIAFCMQQGGQMLKNTVYDNYSVNCYLNNAFGVTVDANYVYCTGNAAYYRAGHPASGIQCANESVSNPIGLYSCTITNNVVANCYSGFRYGSYGLGGGMHGFVIANNVFYSSVGPLFFVDADAGHTANCITRNIIFQTLGNPIAMGSSISGLQFSKNDWWGGTAGLFASSDDIAANPLLVSPGTVGIANYMLQSTSPVLGLGIGPSQN